MAVVVPLLATPSPISSIFRSRTKFCASKIYSFVLSDGRTLATQACTVRTPRERCMNWKRVNNIFSPLLPLRLNCLHFVCLHSRRTTYKVDVLMRNFRFALLPLSILNGRHYKGDHFNCKTEVHFQSLASK